MKELKKYTTGFLFSDSSFLSGAGTVINLAGNFYEFNISESENEADFIAIRNDFEVIGQDLKMAMEKTSLDQ